MAGQFSLPIDKSFKSITGKWYRVIQLLGVGGNAVTYLVLATSGQHKGVLFAAKFFRKISEPERKQRFLGEIQYLMQADHPAIMRVFDSGVYILSSKSEYPFVVAEYLPQTLYHVIRSDIADVPTKISYALQLLSALRFLENSDPQVVHRDIKPQNIFIKGGSCVLGDFGLMLLLDGSDPNDKDVFKESLGPGMPFFYRTPDLVAYAKNEAALTCKSDVFQLGLVLAELFGGYNPLKRAADHLDPIQLGSLGDIHSKQVGGLVFTILQEMLQFDPRKRVSASDIVPKWQTAFSSAAKIANQLNGRVIG